MRLRRKRKRRNRNTGQRDWNMEKSRPIQRGIVETSRIWGEMLMFSSTGVVSQQLQAKKLLRVWTNLMLQTI
jgi:hypothetical protein